LAGALQQASVPSWRPRDACFHRIPAWLGDTDKYSLGEAVHEREQGLLGSPDSKDFLTHPFDARGKPLLAADDPVLGLAQYLD
jgi:hypothetical protein